MPFLDPTSAAAACLICGLGAADQTGFAFCAPPVVPDCIAQAARSHAEADIRSCAATVRRFTHALGTYRLCLQRESESAVAAGNDAVARFRCLALGHGPCIEARGATDR